jgi:hypothetical protein
MDAGPWLTSPKHVDGELWEGQRPVAVVLDPRDAPQPLTLDPDELPVDLHRARVEVDFGPGDGQRLADPKPGGILDLSESNADGLRREVREETGLRIQPETLTGVYKNLPRGIVALVFRCRAAGGALRPTDEADDFRWLHRSQLAAALTPAYAVRLTDALDYAGSASIRTHDGEHVLAGL